MVIYSGLIGLFWLIFIIYWFISSLGVKRNLRGVFWWQGALFRLLIILIFFLIFRIPLFGHFSQYLLNQRLSSNQLLDILGVMLVAAGIAFAIWARVHLGKNWGMPMSLKEKPELITTGPYAFVRHPIYTGIIVAMFGSALVGGWSWFIPFVIFCAYFIYSAKTEEQNMTKEFPKEYPRYMEKTKMLFPFVY